MPFNRPSLTDIKNRVDADIQSRLPGTDPKLRYSLLGILSRVFAGIAHGLYGYLQWISKQIHIDTADPENVIRRAEEYGITPKEAQPAKGNIICTGTDGSTIPVGELLQRSDGVEFITDAIATIAAGTATVAVTAVVGGANTNTAAASVLSFVTPVPGVNSTASVDGTGLIGGIDDETLDSLRSRLKFRIQKPPQGGAAHDYVAWALQVPGVTRAWCYPLEDGAGTVKVRFMMDNSYADGIPLAGDVTTVHNHIEALRPVGLALGGYTTVAPVAAPINFNMTVSPDTSAVRAAVTAELADLILRDSEPGGVIRISRINEAISLAAGETDHALTAPAADITHTVNQIATMGTVTFS